MSLISNLLEALNKATPASASSSGISVGCKVLVKRGNGKVRVVEAMDSDGDFAKLDNGDEVKTENLDKVDDVDITNTPTNPEVTNEAEDNAVDINGEPISVGDAVVADGTDKTVTDVKPMTEEDMETHGTDIGHMVHCDDGEIHHSDECMVTSKSESLKRRKVAVRENRLSKLRESDEVALDSNGQEVAPGDTVKILGQSEAEDQEKEVIAIDPTNDGHIITTHDGENYPAEEVERTGTAEDATFDGIIADETESPEVSTVDTEDANDFGSTDPELDKEIKSEDVVPGSDIEPKTVIAKDDDDFTGTDQKNPDGTAKAKTSPGSSVIGPNQDHLEEDNALDNQEDLASIAAKAKDAFYGQDNKLVTKVVQECRKSGAARRKKLREAAGDAPGSTKIESVTVTPLATMIHLEDGTAITIVGAPVGLSVLRRLKGASIAVTGSTSDESRR